MAKKPTHFFDESAIYQDPNSGDLFNIKNIRQRVVSAWRLDSELNRIQEKAPMSTVMLDAIKIFSREEFSKLRVFDKSGS